MRFAIPSFISLDKNSALEKTMRQTAVKAVPFAKSGAKPQRESDETKNIEKRWEKNPETIRHEAGFTIIVKSEPQSLRDVWGIS